MGKKEREEKFIQEGFYHGIHKGDVNSLKTKRMEAFEFHQLRHNHSTMKAAVESENGSSMFCVKDRIKYAIFADCPDCYSIVVGGFGQTTLYDASEAFEMLKSALRLLSQHKVEFVRALFDSGLVNLKMVEDLFPSCPEAMKPTLLEFRSTYFDAEIRKIAERNNLETEAMRRDLIMDEWTHGIPEGQRRENWTALIQSHLCDAVLQDGARSLQEVLGIFEHEKIYSVEALDALLDEDLALIFGILQGPALKFYRMQVNFALFLKSVLGSSSLSNDVFVELVAAGVTSKKALETLFTTQRVEALRQLGLSLGTIRIIQKVLDMNTLKMHNIVDF